MTIFYLSSLNLKGPSNLTVGALAKHDQSHGEDVTMSDSMSDSRSQSAATFQTWASNWTDCTNTTFGRVHRYWTSGSAFHKEASRANEFYENRCYWTQDFTTVKFYTLGLLETG